jgi:rubrerythrin
MTSLEYYIEQVEQFISALTDDIESGEGTIVTQTKLAVYREVLENLEEIQEDIMTMTKDEALRGLTIGDCRTRREAVKTVKELLNREECEDAISRQAVLNIAKSSKSNWIDNSVLFKRVNELPSVTPQQRTGRWIKQNYGWNWQCSECGFVTPPSAKEIFTFCPNCGAKMEVEE